MSEPIAKVRVSRVWSAGAACGSIVTGKSSLMMAPLLLLSINTVAAGNPVAVSSISDGTDFSGMTLLIVYVLLALTVSAACSVSEAVFLSITPSYIENLATRRPRRAARMRRLRYERVDQSLAAILTLNTIANTAGAILAGTQATIVFGSVWIGVFSSVMTLMILFFSEIIPKTVGAIYWRELAGPTVLFIRAMILLLYPLVRISEGVTRLIGQGKVKHVFSRDEFVAMTGVGEKTGHIDAHESRIIRNLFHFGSLSVSDVMTPRVVVSVLQQGMTIAEAMEHVTGSPFSRFPVYGRDIDDVTGFVLKDEILLHKHHDTARLDTLKRQIHVVPEGMSLPMFLEFLIEHRQHMVIVVDEYGGTAGLATLEDALETLLGMEIKDEMDTVEDMRHMARQKWKARAGKLGITLD